MSSELIKLAMVCLLYIFKIDGDIEHLNNFLLLNKRKSDKFLDNSVNFLRFENGRPHFGIPETIHFRCLLFKLGYY